MSSWGATGKLRVLIEFPAFAWADGGAIGLVLLLTAIALIAVIVLRDGARAWDLEVRAWAGFYPLSSPGHSSRVQQHPPPVPGIPADVALPRDGGDKIRAKVPRDSHNWAGNRRLGPAMGVDFAVSGSERPAWKATLPLTAWADSLFSGGRPTHPGPGSRCRSAAPASRCRHERGTQHRWVARRRSTVGSWQGPRS